MKRVAFVVFFVLWIAAIYVSFNEFINDRNNFQPYPIRDQSNSKLKWSNDLYESAKERATCVNSGECSWSHQGWIETTKKHYKMVIAGENLAKDFFSWNQVYQAWYSSPTHREILLDQRYCEYGEAKVGNVYVLHKGCK